MQLKSSFIFLNNEYAEAKRKAENENRRTENGDKIILTLDLDHNVYAFASKCFPEMVEDKRESTLIKSVYNCDLQLEKDTFSLRLVMINVSGATYLDVTVNGSSKAKIIKCLEYIQDALLNSGIREYYIDIVSYDAISEYYCNKIYPKLNELERNLRKLLFNTYIVNFRSDYYSVTMSKELQEEIMGRIGKIPSEEVEKFKKAYNVRNKKEAIEIERLQMFFYSLEFGDIKDLLFTETWTEADVNNKKEFLSTHSDLSSLTDEELRVAFEEYVPKSDWSRFFASKIDIEDIEKALENIREYRNCIAHSKFLNKSDYIECRNLINRLNVAVLKAIEITEDKDFPEKAYADSRKAMQELREKLNDYVNRISTAMNKTLQIIRPAYRGLNEFIRNGLSELYVDGSLEETPLDEDRSESDETSEIKSVTEL